MQGVAAVFIAPVKGFAPTVGNAITGWYLCKSFLIEYDCNGARMGFGHYVCVNDKGDIFLPAAITDKNVRGLFETGLPPQNVFIDIRTQEQRQAYCCPPFLELLEEGPS